MQFPLRVKLRGEAEKEKGSLLMTSRIKGVVKSGLNEVREGGNLSLSNRTCKVVPWFLILVNFSVQVSKDIF